MKKFLVLILMSFFTLQVYSQTCGQTSILGKDPVDPWPWAVAQPFPWDNMDGYWKLGDEDGVYIRARVIKRTADSNKKLLQLWIYREGICAKPIARGNGYIDFAEKNVVNAFMIDDTYRFRFKLASFAMKDISEDVSPTCNKRVLAASYQVIGLAGQPREKGTLDPSVTEVQNMMLKKVTVNPDTACKK